MEVIDLKINRGKRIKWYQCKQDNGFKIFKKAMSNNKINKTNKNDWDIILPCKHKYDKNALDQIKINDSSQIISIVSQSGILGSKKTLWITLYNFYGRNIAQNIMPPSYIFPKDIQEFKKNYKKGQYYILKQEKQRQTGLKLSNSYNEIVNSWKDSYVVAQKYLNNCLTYKGYKINLRIYLVYICKGTNKMAYIFNDGIVSYAKIKPKNNNIDSQSGISSFYSSKDLYDQGYPITIKKIVDQYNVPKWNNMMKSIENKLYLMVNASKDHMCNYAYKHKNISYQLFGADFYVDTKFKPTLLEVNIGPGMDPYSDEDKIMRIELHNNILSLLGLTNKSHQSMIQIY